MDMLLNDKILTVTGGTKGLGRAIAIAAAKAGARVVISGRDEQAGAEVVREIQDGGGEGLFIAADITQVKRCEHLIARTVEAFGRVDCLVNYAGMLPAGYLPETSEDLYNSVMDLNLKATFFCCKYAIREMLKTGGGSILNIGSTHAYGGDKDRAIYACSKGAMLVLTKHISMNYARQNIRANWLTMGWVATPGELAHRKTEGHDINWLNEAAREAMPMGRLQTYEDNIPGALYLLSDQASQVTGVELHVNGGYFPSGSVEA